MKKLTRHGQLADGMTTFSFVIPRELKAALRKMADDSERNLGDFLRRECSRIVREGMQKSPAAGIQVVDESQRDTVRSVIDAKPMIRAKKEKRA